MTAVTSRSIIKELKAVFARVGLPDIVTDNGPQFASARFAVFARTWGFDHVTLSPTYAQSNGKSKCRADNQASLHEMLTEHLAVLDWRNMPSRETGTRHRSKDPSFVRKKTTATILLQQGCKASGGYRARRDGRSHQTPAWHYVFT